MKWMAHSVLAVIAAFVLGALCAGCTEADGGAVSTVAVPDEPPPRRLEFPGFSILPPSGEGWERLTNRGAARLLLGFDGLFVKVVSPKELAHAYVAGHRASGGSAGPEILAGAFARFIKSRNASSVTLPGATAPPNCLRWEMTREATDYFHGIQFGHTSARVSQYQGYLCSHPDAPAYVVEVGYVDTVVKGEAMSAVGQGEAFLHSLVLTPLGVKVKQFSAGKKVRSAALAANALWLTEEDSGTVSRLNPDTGAIVASVPVGKKPEGLAAGAGAVWVPNWASDTVSRIDPQSNRVVATIPVARGPTDVALAQESVWVTNEKSRSISRIDPSANRVTATIPIDGRPVAIAASRNALWVENFNTDIIWRIDPETNQAASIRVGRGRHLIAAGRDAVWVSNSVDNSVSRIDPATNRVVATIKVGRTPIGLALTRDTLWVANFSDGTVSRIDRRTNQVSGQPIPVGENPFLVSTDHKTVWVLSVWAWEQGTLSKIRF